MVGDFQTPAKIIASPKITPFSGAAITAIDTPVGNSDFKSLMVRTSTQDQSNSEAVIQSGDETEKKV